MRSWCKVIWCRSRVAGIYHIWQQIMMKFPSHTDGLCSCSAIYVLKYPLIILYTKCYSLAKWNFKSTLNIRVSDLYMSNTDPNTTKLAKLDPECWNVSLYESMYAWLYVCINVCVYLCECMYAWMPACLCAWMHVCMNPWRQIHTGTVWILI